MPTDLYDIYPACLKMCGSHDFVSAHKALRANMESPCQVEATDDVDSDENLLTLRSSTLTALTSFLDEQATDFETITSLTTQPYPLHFNPLQRDYDINEAHAEILRSRPSEDQTSPENPSEETQGRDTAGCVPVDRFKRVFKLVLKP